MGSFDPTEGRGELNRIRDHFGELRGGGGGGLGQLQRGAENFLGIAPVGGGSRDCDSHRGGDPLLFLGAGNRRRMGDFPDLLGQVESGVRLIGAFGLCPLDRRGSDGFGQAIFYGDNRKKQRQGIAPETRGRSSDHSVTFSKRSLGRTNDVTAIARAFKWAVIVVVIPAVAA